MILLPKPNIIQFRVIWGIGGKLGDAVWKLKCGKFLHRVVLMEKTTVLVQ